MTCRRELKAIEVLTSNIEGKMFCEIDGWVLRGVQFGVLFGVLFELLVTVRVHFCNIDGGVLGGMQSVLLAQVLFCDAVCSAGAAAVLRVWECCLGVLFRVMARAHFCTDERMLGGMPLGVAGAGGWGGLVTGASAFVQD